MRKKVIFHLDIDSYFASAICTLEEELIGKPLAISTGGRRSIVSALSYEAKALGAYVPMPLYKVREIIPNVIVRPLNFNLYIKLSRDLFDLIANKYTKEIEVGSIDECYIDVTDIWKKHGSPMNLAREIQNEIKRKLKLPVSIGISDNKFVAKMSSPINKPFGITITPPGKFANVFWSKDIQKFFGIGNSWSEKLREIGINTIGDLATSDEKTLRPVLGKNFQTFIDKANGISNEPVNTELNDLKSISNSITFQDKDRYIRSEVIEIVDMLLTKTHLRLKNRNLLGKVVSVGIKVTGGKSVKMQRKQIKLERPTDDKEELRSVIIALLDTIWNDESIKFISISVNDLYDKFNTYVQSTIFDKQEKSEVNKIIERVNQSIGKGKVVTTGKEHLENLKKKEKQSRYLETDRLL